MMTLPNCIITKSAEMQTHPHVVLLADLGVGAREAMLYAVKDYDRIDVATRAMLRPALKDCAVRIGLDVSVIYLPSLDTLGRSRDDRASVLLIDCLALSAKMIGLIDRLTHQYPKIIVRPLNDTQRGLDALLKSGFKIVTMRDEEMRSLYEQAR